MSDRQQLNEMKKFLQIAENFVKEPEQADAWNAPEGDAFHDEQPAQPIQITAYEDISELYMKEGDMVYVEPSNNAGELYSEENGFTIDWDYLTHLEQSGMVGLDIGSGQQDPGQMVPYEESVETFGEEADPENTVCGVCDKGFVPVGNPDEEMCPSCTQEYLGEEGDDDLGPAAQSKSSIMKDVADEKGWDVIDVPLSGDEGRDYELKYDAQLEVYVVIFGNHVIATGTDDYDEAMYQADDIYDNRFDLEEDENDARGKMCGVCSGGRRDGYGNDCPNCDGEGYVDESVDLPSSPDENPSYDLEYSAELGVYLVIFGKHVIPTGTDDYEEAQYQAADIYADRHNLEEAMLDEETQYAAFFDNRADAEKYQIKHGGTVNQHDSNKFGYGYEVVRDVDAVMPEEGLTEVGAVKYDDYGVVEDKAEDNADECKRCSGLGHHPSKPNVECPECLGTGKASVVVKPEGMQEPYRPENRPHTPGYSGLSGAEQGAADSRAQAFIFDEDSMGESEELPPIHAIANDIIKNWKKVYFGAVPYLKAMQTLSTKHDDYGADSGSSILAYGLGNMSHYSGRSVHDPELAKKHRAQLKRHLKEEINLSGIVEAVLQEFPGQPKDYADDEEFEREQAERSKHIQNQAKEFEQDHIDPEIEDEELGLRFD